MTETSSSPDAVRGLVADLTANAKTAAAELNEVKRVHTALAKAEVAEKITKPAIGAIVMFTLAGILALDALMLLFVTAALGLHHGTDLTLWASFGIVAGVILLITAILGLIGASQAKKIGPPERSINAAKHLVARLKAAIS